MDKDRKTYQGRLYPDMKKVLTNLYTIWAEEHGVVLTNIVVTRKKGVPLDLGNPFQDPNEEIEE